MAMNPGQQSFNLFITYVDKEGPFLKVWGQAERSNSVYVEQFLLGASQQFEQGIGKIPFENLQVGTLVCVKYTDNKYYRARIVSIDFLNQQFVEVNFLDYGYKDVVPSENIRSLQNFPTSFISIPPLATGFIFAEAHCPGGGEWKEQIFECVSKELQFREVQCNLLTQATQYYFVKLYIENTDIGSLFISRGLMQSIPLHAQQAVLLSMSIQKKSSSLAGQMASSAEINTYKACTLEPMQQYAVYVSFVNEGPTHFSVQLQQSEHVLAKLMKEINETNLRMLDEVPLPGTICLARCQEDETICRAVVTNEVDNQFKVFYVDFGNYETLPLECLYRIPFKYVLPKVMAIRVALNGVEKSTVTMEMLLAFKKFVDNRLLHMKVLPSTKKTAITKCELWDPETKTGAIDVINRAAQHAYPDPLVLNRGFTQPVKVSYVFSCSRFYVQLLSKEQELAKLMTDLQVSCQSSDGISDIKIGLPCCALFEGDQLWYRSDIVDIVDNENVKVRYIDYGNEEVVPTVHLRVVEGELLTVLRPQAIECCLNGYQNMGADESRDALLEQLIFEQNFTMKVSEMLGKKALVELIDANNYNVASLLLEKMAASKSQVSPMLVQAGNTLEYRKSSDSSDQYRPQKATRNFEKPHEKSWRNEKNDSRHNDVNSNDGSEDNGSWKSNNKGFSRNDKRGDRIQGPNFNERFNRNRDDRDGRNNNWNNKENGFQNSPSWSSPVKEAPPPAADDVWRNSTPSPVQGNFEGRRDDRFGGRKKFDDRRDRDDTSDKRGRNRDDKREKGEWNRDDRGEKGGWNRDDKRDRGGWNRDDKADKGGWNRDDKGDKGGWNRGGKADRGGWNTKDGFKRNDFGKSRFPKSIRDGSEKSSSGSEKSFRKGPRTSSRNDLGGGKRFQHRSESSFGNAAVSDSWSVSDVSTPSDAAPSTASFEQQNVTGTEAAVVISWFHNPGHFYCQLQSGQPEFKSLMEEIQQFYKNRKPEPCVVGAPVVALFPEDNVLYRAQVLEAFGGEYKVFYVDFGNVSSVSKVWPIEKKFIQMPAEAICCGLGGVAPKGDGWGDPSAFTEFFAKDFFMARFLEKDESRTYTQLWYHQDEVSQLLVRGGLAEPLAPKGGEGIEIPLLFNQQFRVVLKSVNSLGDIIVALECGLALSCKAHNLDLAAELHEDVLKAYIEQPVIVYVDNILEKDILEITFYDTLGSKLEILAPDEGALDSVDPLCPLLVLSSQISGYVSHANETAVFVQPNSYADLVPALLEQMYDAYENSAEETTIIPEEGFVYAVHSEDGNWYRGRVDSFDDNKATVFYVDYGNTESVAFSALRELKETFFVPNVMCLQITVPSGSAPSFLAKEVVATIYYGETGWEGSLEQCPQLTETEEVTATIGEPAAFEESTLVQEIAEAPNQSHADQKVEENGAKEILGNKEPPQKGTPVYVSHIDSPTEFYVQFAQSSDTLAELQQTLQNTNEQMPVLENISVGVLCAAPYSLDQQWYRAEVLDADEDITTVRFVDYGNTDVINNQTTRVKTLPSALLTLAVYATRCSLKLKALEDEWSQQALELFEELANREGVVAEFIAQDEKINIVELYSNGRNVKEALLALNLAVPCEIVMETKSTCFVSHLNSPSEFWVQMENCVDELEWIAEQLSGAESFPELEDMAPGTLCVALFPDDHMWYRARILSNTVAGIELLFIDYGNSCISSSLRQLPEDLVVTPPLAQKCCLQRPDGVPYWTNEARDKFAEISAYGQTIFQIKKINTGETATVELLLNGENVVPRILPVTEEGRVRNFETLNKFDVEIQGELLPESVCLEPMPTMEWNEESNRIFCELYPEATLFQVERIGEDCVRLYKEGADIRPGLGGTKSMNLSNKEEQKTDDLDISEDRVIAYQEGSHNLVDTEHSIEKGASIKLQQVCDKQDESKSAGADDMPKKEEGPPSELKRLENDETTRESSGNIPENPESAALPDPLKDTAITHEEDSGKGESSTEIEDKTNTPELELSKTEELLPEQDKTNIPEAELPKTVEEPPKQTKVESGRPKSAGNSRSSSSERSRTPHDEKILPGCVSRPHTPLIVEEEVQPTSRPSSSLGRRVSHDDKILPAVLSRPQTPTPEVSEEN